MAPDKFKGTLTSKEVARAMSEGIEHVLPQASTTVVALGDGGEGSLDALLARAGGEIHRFHASDPLGRAVAAPVAFLPDGSVFVESAAASGLGLLDDLDSLNATSRGTGELIVRSAARATGSAPMIVVGVGGTASTDGGTGAAAAAGWRFLDSRGEELPPGGAALLALDRIDGAGVDPGLDGCRVIAACDVISPLVGPKGAARVFAPQKGASTHEVELLATALDRLATVVERDVGVDVRSIPRGGAGGGLGAGLAAFFGAELVSGFDFVAGAVGLSEEVRDADLVVTGEGRLDATTSEGKVVSGLAALALSRGVECVAVAGEVDGVAASTMGLSRVVSLVHCFGRERAVADAYSCIRDATAALVRG